MSNTKKSVDNFSSIKSELDSSKVRLTLIIDELNKFRSESHQENPNNKIVRYQNDEVKGNQLLATTGFLQKVVVEDNMVYLEGWVISFKDDLVDGFKVSIASQEIKDCEIELQLPTPHLKQAFPKLKNVDQAGFSIKIPFHKEQQNWQDALVILTPLFSGYEGFILVNALQSSVPIPSTEYLQWAGGGGENGAFLRNSFAFLGYFIQLAKLKPTDRVLEVGSGLGRMAYGLAHYLKPPGSYEGFEIMARFIKWPQQEISTRHPHFNFRLVNIYNHHYNPGGNIKAKDFVFPYENESFDFVFLTSVFTHMQTEEVRHYLEEIYRVLKFGGKCLCSCFLLNKESENLISEGKSGFEFVHELNKCFTTNPDNPEAAIAFSESLLLNWISESGFSVSNKYYGAWCGREEYTSGQDILILKKSMKNLEPKIVNTEKNQLVNNQNEFLYLRDAELASYVDEKGAIKFAELDTPRIDYDPNPATCDTDGKHKCLGLLVECASINRLIYSTNMTYFCWIKYHQISTVAEENILSPELTSGNNQVISIIDLPQDDFHLIRQRVINGSKIDRTISIFVKRVENAGTKDFAIWGLHGLQIAVFSRKDWSFISGKASHTNLEFYPHGWVRLSATYNYSNDDIYFGTSAGKNSRYLGENKKQFYLYGPQLEDLSQATSYIPTNEKPRQRGADLVGINNIFYNGYSAKSNQRHIALTKQQITDLKLNSSQEKSWWLKSIADVSKQIDKLTNIVAEPSVKLLTSAVSLKPEILGDNLQKLAHNVEKIIVLDVGARGGVNPVWNKAIEVGIDVEFYLSEPDRQSFEDLRKIYPNLKCIPYALGNNNTEATLYLTSSPACSSLRKPNFAVLNSYPVKRMFNVVREEKVNCYRYDYLVKHENAPIPEFIKIDVQGFEYEVLEGFGEDLNQVLAVELESHFYPIYQGQKLAVEVIQYLEKYGLILRKIEPHGPFEGELVEANLFFTKRKSTIGTAMARKVSLWECLFNIPQE